MGSAAETSLAGRGRFSNLRGIALPGMGAFVLLYCISAQGSGFRNPPESASGLGVVGGRYTLVDDASAMAFNPANLTAVHSNSVLLSVTAAHSGCDFTDLSGAQASTISSWYFLPSAYVALPIGGTPVVAGLGVITPYGQATEWRRTGALQYTAPYLAEVTVVNLNPTVAVRIMDSLSVAGGADIYLSELDMRQLYPPSRDDSSDGKLHLNGDGHGYGGNVGVTWRIGARHTVGAIYRSGVDVDYDGDFSTSISRELASPKLPPFMFSVGFSSAASTGIDFPGIWGVGYAYAVSDSLRLAADVDRIDFSSFDTLNVDVESLAGWPLGAPSVPQNWNDAWAAGLGAEWDASACWTMLAGYIFMETPIPDETFSPTLPDGEQHVVSVGIRFHRRAHAVNLSYAIGFNEDRDIRDNLVPEYNGHYEIETGHLVGLAYNLTF